MILALVPRRIHRHRKLRNVAIFKLADLAHALFIDLVNANDRVHRQVGSADVFKLGFDLLFRRIDDQCRALAKDKFFDLHETKQLALANTSGVNLVDLPLAHEDDFVELFFTHGIRCSVRARSLPKSARRGAILARTPDITVYGTYGAAHTTRNTSLCELLGIQIF
jgi:hypothetical protein